MAAEFLHLPHWIPALAGVALMTVLAPSPGSAGGKERSVLDFTMTSIDGKEVPLAAYRGKVLLLVNVASRCGYTPQYKDLETLYRTYRERGLVILGFPANNFGAQEPGTDEEIREFCTTTYGVSFDMFSKISVKGDDQHTLYRFITSEKTNPGFGGEIAWNFQKYLVGRDGKIVGKYASKVGPMSKELTAAVERELAKKVSR